MASGKSRLVRYLANNPPEGYKLKTSSAAIPTVHGAEYWCLVFEKIKIKRKKVS